MMLHVNYVHTVRSPTGQLDAFALNTPADNDPVWANYVGSRDQKDHCSICNCDVCDLSCGGLVV